MIRIAVVDDQKNDLAYIKKGIGKQLDLRNIKYKLYLYIDASKLLQDNENDPFDVVFLDIDMPQLTGMDAAESINNISPKTIIVFVTNHDELVYKAYRFKAVGFVRKSLNCQPKIGQKLFSRMASFKLNGRKITERAVNTKSIEPMNIISEFKF